MSHSQDFVQIEIGMSINESNRLDPLVSGLSADDVADIAGITSHQFEYWRRSGRIELKGDDSGLVRRRFNEHEARQVLLLAEIAKQCDLGNSPSWLHIEYMYREGGIWLWDARGRELTPFSNLAPWPNKTALVWIQVASDRMKHDLASGQVAGPAEEAAR